VRGIGIDMKDWASVNLRLRSLGKEVVGQFS